MKTEDQYQAHGGELKNLMADSAQSAALHEKVLRLPRLNLTDRQLCDLELLLIGAFSPLEGFMNEADYTSVVEKGRLSSDVLWPMPIVLDVPSSDNYEKGNEVVLCDAYGNPLAIFTIESAYTPDKQKESLAVYGTTDTTHPGVRYLFEETRDTYFGGTVIGLALPERHDFSELRLTPRDVRAFKEQWGWDKLIGFQTRNPMHRVHFELVKQASIDHDAPVLIHPAVGLTKEGDLDYITRIRTYKIIQDKYGKDFTKLAVLPLAMRMAGPKEALWHAIIRKNYGCTHFIVGRDHAGPGKDKDGKDFYDLSAARLLVKSFEDELGIVVADSPEMVYVAELKEYQHVDKVAPGHTVMNISGTQFRNKLRNREEIPEWFSFPETIDELRKGAEKQRRRGMTIFLTGLSGAGKSTIAKILYNKLLEIQDRTITFLDGDVIRQNLSHGLGFSQKDRETNIERVGFVAAEITKHGGIAVCSLIAPYKSSREKNRSLISHYGKYIEVFVDTPLEVCIKRDTKGLYEKAQKGLIKNFTGVSDPYEAPQDAEIVLDASTVSAQESAQAIIDYLQKENLLQS